MNLCIFLIIYLSFHLFVQIKIQILSSFNLSIYGGRRFYQYNEDYFRFKCYNLFKDFKQHGYTKIFKQREAIN